VPTIQVRGTVPPLKTDLDGPRVSYLGAQRVVSNDSTLTQCMHAHCLYMNSNSEYRQRALQGVRGLDFPQREAGTVQQSARLNLLFTTLHCLTSSSM
jgi:hypothetical protein